MKDKNQKDIFMKSQNYSDETYYKKCRVWGQIIN